jgi:hypothetical protein
MNDINLSEIGACKPMSKKEMILESEATFEHRARFGASLLSWIQELIRKKSFYLSEPDSAETEEKIPNKGREDHGIDLSKDTKCTDGSEGVQDPELSEKIVLICMDIRFHEAYMDIVGKKQKQNNADARKR